jgi:predicted O-methyltransferase YrrM
MSIEYALTVPGWMTEEELIWLAIAAGNKSLIVEVGSWMGRSTSALAENTLGIVIACDTWEGSEEHFDMLRDKPKGWLKEQFLAHAGRYENMAFFQSRSLDLAAALVKLDIRPDMVFLDASHDYESVKADILAWMPLLRPGGVLCGHDYDPPHWMGIKQAVDELIPDRVVVTATTIWRTA